MAAHANLGLEPTRWHADLAASSLSELQLTRDVLAVLPVLPVLLHGEPGQVQLSSADVATTRVSLRRYGQLDLITTNLRSTFDRCAIKA